MKIKSLYMRDFGVFRDEKINDIDKNVVVIGGFNRAGKTTLMQAIKHLGYGITKGEKIPKPNIKYDYASDILDDYGNIYNINIDGYSKPTISSLNNNINLSVNDIYGNIDFFTYSQLFTISLDELNYIKENIDIDQKLQSLFLGAGYKEIMCIPKIVNNLNKVSNKIGKKQGRPNSGMFKKYNTNIKNMVKKRDEALKEIEKYASLKQELKDTCLQLEEIKCRSGKVDKEITIIDVLKNNYNDYYTKITIDDEIEDIFINKGYNEEFVEKIKLYNQNYINIMEKYKVMIFNFKEKVSKDIGVKDKFLDNRDIIKQYDNKLTLINEKVKNYYKNKNALNNKINQILSQIKTTNFNWNDLKDIKNIQIDNITLSTLNDNIDEYNYLKNIIDKDNNKIEEYSSKMNLIKEKLNKNNEYSNLAYMRKYFRLSLIFTILGIIISFLNTAAGIIICCGGIGGLIVYNVYKSNLNKVLLNNNNELQNEFEDIKRKLDIGKNNLEKNNEKILKIVRYFDNIKNSLKIRQDISIYSIKDYINAVLNFKRYIIEIENIEIDLLDQKNYMMNELDNIAYFIKNIEYIEIKKSNLNLYVNEILDEFVNIKRKLSVTEEFKEIIDEKEEYEERIKELFANENLNHKNQNIKNKSIESILNKELIGIKKYKEYSLKKQKSLEIEKRILQVFKTQRVMQAFEIKDIHDISFQILNKYYQEYISIEDINEKYNQKIELQNQYINKINELSQYIEKLKYNIEKLNSSKIIEETQKELDRSRNELIPVAEKYAVYSTASFLLNKIQSKLIDNIKKFAFQNSSEILKYVTNGDYKEISPNQDLDSVDFKLLFKDGTINNSIELLSRGTKEQLFFSVRIGKIRQIKSLLPIIFDDCFVNFDFKHITNTINVIHELSKTNQVFILTCHPYLVQYISKNINDVKYLKLENGKFSVTSSSELQNYLWKN